MTTSLRGAVSWRAARKWAPAWCVTWGPPQHHEQTNKERGKKERKVDNRSFSFFFNLTRPSAILELRRGGGPGDLALHGACGALATQKRRLLVQRPVSLQKVTLPGTTLRPCCMVLDSLKHKSPKSWNSVSEGRAVNVGKRVLEECGTFPGPASATRSSLRSYMFVKYSQSYQRKKHSYRQQPRPSSFQLHAGSVHDFTQSCPVGSSRAVCPQAATSSRWAAGSPSR